MFVTPLDDRVHLAQECGGQQEYAAFYHDPLRVCLPCLRIWKGDVDHDMNVYLDFLGIPSAQAGSGQRSVFQICCKRKVS